LPKTINIHVGFTAGGPADTTARLIAEKLRESTGSAVVVQNRPGAGGTIAAAAVAQMEPDGGNLLLVSSGHTGAPALYPNLKFDNQRDFTPNRGAGAVADHHSGAQGIALPATSRR